MPLSKDDVINISSQAKFTLIPATWTKKIDRELRKEAVHQLNALLKRAFLAASGLRAEGEENELFEKLNAPRSSHRQR